MKEFKQSPPWVVFYRKIDALFGQDPDIDIFWNADAKVLRLIVDDGDKAEALVKLLPMEKDFGGQKLVIEVIPANTALSSRASLFRDAFRGNPVFSRVETVQGVYANTLDYVEFRPEIVQYWSDNMGDLNGITTTLYEDIARDVFDVPGCFYNTELINGDIRTSRPEDI